MAKLYGAAYNALNGITTGTTVNDIQIPQYAPCELLGMIDVYTGTGSESAGTDYALMCGLLPAKAKMIAILVEYTAHGGSAALDIGDVASSTRYKSSLSVVSAGSTLVPCSQYEIGTATGDNQLRFTVQGSSLALAGTVKFTPLFLKAA